eukprot:gene1025-1087_t
MSSRSKMPHNNRVSSSTALKTNDMWSKTIGYDPYANQDEDKDTEKNAIHAESLMLLARISNLSGVESRGGCKRCGMLGHLTYQCRNPVQNDDGAKSESSESDSDDSVVAPLNSSSANERKRSEDKDKPKKKKGKKRKRESESEDEEHSVRSSSSSDDESERSRKKSKKEKKHKKKSKKSKKQKKQKH